MADRLPTKDECIDRAAAVYAVVLQEIADRKAREAYIAQQAAEEGDAT